MQNETSKKTTTDFNPSCFWTVKITIEPKLALLLLFTLLEHVIVPKSTDMIWIFGQKIWNIKTKWLILDNWTEDLKYQN